MTQRTINGDMKMAGLIHLDPRLLPVINRFGIRLGFGDQSIDEVCRSFNVDTRFFLEIVNAFHDEKYFPASHLQQFDAGMIINYLSATHHYYLEVKVPELQLLIDRLVENTGPEHRNTSELLSSFFSNYVAELKDHLKLEEQGTFPYVLSLQRQLDGIVQESGTEKLNEEYSMYEFIEEHSNLEDQLLDLKNIIIKYIDSPLNSNLCNKILDALFQLESDLRDHARIEDKVLVPKVKMMEKKLTASKSRSGSSNLQNE
ncbi:MAG: hemerythrin domain-containing protein [Bacteroidales bacterium]|nr:hemerythrin domain-containing protein [Bacteroidales bacterium]